MSYHPNSTSRKRCLHIGKYFPPHRGGMETALRDQMNMQARDEGFMVAAVVHSSQRRITDTVELHPLGYRVRYAARYFTVIFAPIAPFFAWSAYRGIKDLNPDEIRIHMPNLSAAWLLLLPSARNKKWTVLWHSDVLPSKYSFGLRLFYGLYRFIETAILRHADSIIATSPPYLNTSAPLAEFREKCRVEPLKLDVARIRAITPPGCEYSGGGDAILRVLCVGRLTYYKDFSTAIRAIKLLPEAHLRIIGSGAESRKLESLIKDLNVSDRVKLCGELEDDALAASYAWCDILCLPSIERTEAFGLVILEAAAHGKPSIVANTDGSGMGWIIQKIAPKGFTFSAGDERDLANELRCFHGRSRGTTPQLPR